MDIALNKLVSLAGNYTINGSVNISSEATNTINIEVNTITDNLTVYAPNATVSNSATVNGTITITDVASTTWNENANGNAIVVDDKDITLNVIGESTTITIPDTLDLTNVKIDIKGADTTLITTKPVNAKVATGVTVTVKADAKDTEGTPVKGTGEQVELKPEVPVIEPKLELSQTEINIETETAIENESGRITGTFNADGRTPIDVTLTKGSEDYTNVRVMVEGGNDGIQLLAQDTNGNWYDIVITGWGTPGGFPIADATTPVYVVANEAGTYNLTIKLVDENDDKNELATATGTVVAIESTPEDETVPVLGDTTLTNGEDMNLILTVTATDEGDNLASLEVDHSLEGTLPEFTLDTTTEFTVNFEDGDPRNVFNGTRYTYENGTWKIYFNSHVTNIIRKDAGETMTFYFVIKDEVGNQFGDMYNVTGEMTREISVPAAE